MTRENDDTCITIIVFSFTSHLSMINSSETVYGNQ